MQWWVKIILICTFVCNSFQAKSQDFYPDSLNKKNLNWLIAAESFTYVSSMSALYFVWYKNQMSSSFRFFNDAQEWKGMDKIGHVQTAYYLAETSHFLYRSVGVPDKNAVIAGSSQSFLFQSTLEVFDGFSTGYGFSWSDMGANTLGCGLFLSQHLIWNEQRFRLKFSSSPSNYAKHRPELLGSNFSEQLLKDYNGQTYWLSGNISSFLSEESKFPKWINVAFGYGADGLLGGKTNPAINSKAEIIPMFDRQSQYYFSMDVDFSRIRVKRKWLHYTLKIFNFIKLPFPALEITGKVWRVKPIYF